MSDRRNVYLFYHKDEKLVKKIQPLITLIEREGFHLVEDPDHANIIVSIGGDGAFLQAIRKTNFRDDCLYSGVSIKNTINLYCDFHIEELDKIVEAMREEKVEVRRYPVLDVTIDKNIKFQCLNECSIRSSIIKAFVMDVYIDDLHFETFRGDGMIVATPTGSTAYNKSVKGAVVDPLLPCFQVSEIASLNNNLYRTLGSSFILSTGRKLTLKIVQDGNDHPLIGMDNEALSVKHIDEIEFSLSKKRIKTVKLKDNSFWAKVKRTFL
ncbi:NAD kinase [Metabacillus fastidiosus]|uniref:NAD kinase n=1 Tax=Metabacillus fastidiosus TaxID=1458 RepID=UPI002E23EE7A|nr:NAD kinase [Metabacillus fastidiosus]MED4531023.1 NAD kinase [Metabacillus fastidiosus]